MLNSTEGFVLYIISIA